MKQHGGSSHRSHGNNHDLLPADVAKQMVGGNHTGRVGPVDSAKQEALLLFRPGKRAVLKWRAMKYLDCVYVCVCAFVIFSCI